MKLVLPLAAFAYIASGVCSLAAALTATSLAPAWVAASEKDAWIGAFKFAKSAADRPGIAKCLDKMAALPPFATNKLRA